jgi:hypothetical protein
MRLPNRAQYLTLIQRLAFWGGRWWVRVLFACAALPLMLDLPLGQPLDFLLQVIFIITLLLSIVLANIVGLAEHRPSRRSLAPTPLGTAFWGGMWIVFLAGYALVPAIAYGLVCVVIPALRVEALLYAVMAIGALWLGLCLLIVGALLALTLAVLIFVPLRALVRVGWRRWQRWRFAQVSREWYTQPLLNGTRRDRSEVR